MRVVVLGSGDLTKIPRHTAVRKNELEELIAGLGRLLAERGHELIIIPDRGVPTEVAKAYKKAGGPRLLGLVPLHDTEYGIEHIRANLPMLDEQVEANHWYDADGEIAASGDVCVIVGMSPGIMREFCVLKYHARYLGNRTKVMWFANTMSGKLPPEIGEEIPVTYVSSLKELEKHL
ncbi:hypothetical protein JXB02_01345 [Candidatus Woesearchaeota archaeon]|nr:hypothetical protein [Candidatus Woesearchaeota archaeon]